MSSPASSVKRTLSFTPSPISNKRSRNDDYISSPEVEFIPIVAPPRVVIDLCSSSDESEELSSEDEEEELVVLHRTSNIKTLPSWADAYPAYVPHPLLHSPNSINLDTPTDGWEVSVAAATPSSIFNLSPVEDISDESSVSTEEDEAEAEAAGYDDSTRSPEDTPTSLGGFIVDDDELVSVASDADSDADLYWHEAL